MKILDIIYQKQSEVPPNIAIWLKSQNESIVLLAIKLMIRYKTKLTFPKITYLLRTLLIVWSEKKHFLQLESFILK